jgi:hypothetical protein
MATRFTLGAISVSSSSILAPIAASDVKKPVIFAPGRERAATNPSPTGSVTTTNTMGIVRVSRWSAAVTGFLARRSVGLQGDQLFRKSPYLIDITTTPANLHPQDTTVSPTQFCEPLPEPRELGLSLGSFSSTLMSTPMRLDAIEFCALAVPPMSQPRREN